MKPDIENLGVSIIEQLVDKGLVKAWPTLCAQAKDLEALNGWEQSPPKIWWKVLSKAKGVARAAYLRARNSDVGVHTAYILAGQLGAWRLSESSAKDLEGIRDRAGDRAIHS